METRKPRRFGRWIAAAAALLALVCGALYWYSGRADARKLDEAAAANARGIAFLERYDLVEADGRTAFENASDQFRLAMALAPDWTPARINYGMSLFFTGKDAKIDEAIRVFESILQTEPKNPYANHCLGIIHFYRSEAEPANRYFTAVTEIDPDDAYAWYFRGFTIPDREESELARDCFEKAVRLDPYLTTARYSLAGHIAINDPKVREQMQEEIAALRAAFWERVADTKPSKLGKYGTPIGAAPAPPFALDPLPALDARNTLRVELEPGTTWAAKADGFAGAIRQRFGGTLVQLDFDGDGRPDLFVPASVERNGQLGDLLLRNEGGSRFVDVTNNWGLAKGRGTGCAVADFDNSGFPDLVVCGEDGVRLLKNRDGKAFEDVTAAAGLDALRGRFLTACWIDLDQDGDLDLILVQGESTPGAGDGALLAYTNVGVAPPTPPNQPTIPLTVAFQRFAHPAFAIAGPVVGVAASDLDNDGDVDLIVFVSDQRPAVILNDRLLRFHRGEPVTDSAGAWTGGLVLDANRDDQSDLVCLAGAAKPTLLLTATDRVGPYAPDRFTRGDVDGPALNHAQAIDFDHDGFADVLGLSVDRKAVLLRGDGRRLKAEPEFATPADLLAVAACDVDGDCHNDLLVWSAAEGLLAFRNPGNGNRGLRLEITGKREKEAARTNRDAVGAKVTAYAGRSRTRIENTTLAAGLGQSRGPLDFGIGRADVAHAVRIAWPDVVPQAEVDLPACTTQKILETDRRSSSCPVLFAWDGTRYRYVTDILGAGSMGELGADGSTRPPRAEESVKIDAAYLKPRAGRYAIKLAEPMDELLYLDRVRLEVADHPADAEVYPDERFATADPQPTQQILTFRERWTPRAARDQAGRDLTETLSARDGRTAAGFRKRAWHGFAEEHSVELDFGDSLARLKPGSALHLILSGWTDYAYPETIFGAAQAGVLMQPPVLERLTETGTWEKVGEIGFPAGLPRTMTSPVPGLAGLAKTRLRIRTNMHIYWDHVQIGLAESAPIRTHELPLAAARLNRDGFAKEVFPAGRPPAAYDDTRREPVTFSRWRGRITRLGDVTELLDAHDDRFVICGPGDEIVVEFDAARLPPLPDGYRRSFILRSNGYCKDAAPFTATFGEVGPLPFRTMTSYPEGARHGAPAAQREYDRIWNTRTAGMR